MKGRGVNLERPAAVGDRLSGHIVQGHVDGTAEFLSLDPLPDGNWWLESSRAHRSGPLHDSQRLNHPRWREPNHRVAGKQRGRSAIIRSRMKTR